MDKKYLAAFGAFPNIQTKHFLKLTEFFPTFEKAWHATIGDYILAGFAEKWVDNFVAYRKETVPEKIINEIKENNINIIAITDNDYPENLKEIYNPPYLLYIKGKIANINKTIAIVGARKADRYGRKCSFEIAKELAKQNFVIVSGLAIGIDTEAHKGALSGGGITYAVLANGLDTIYPKENTKLAESIIENGCLLSEQPLRTRPEKSNFPARNRIISGLSTGVLIVQAGEYSGTLHTASFALEQNRQLYAIPGSIDSQLSIGPNELLRRGAIPVTTANDIIADYQTNY